MNDRAHVLYDEVWAFFLHFVIDGFVGLWNDAVLTSKFL
jgi:hypothetical protein